MQVLAARSGQRAVHMVSHQGVGEVVAVREGSGDPVTGVGSHDVVFAKMAAAGVPDLPISAGTLDVAVTVTVTYALDR